MWPLLTLLLSALALTVAQVAFLSHLFPPLTDVSFPLAAMSYALLRDRPLTAVGWALFGGLTLDLHGLFGFGTETAVLLAAFLAARFMFGRVLTNASAAAAFLLTAFAVLVRWLGLFVIDGLRVLSGGVPHLIVADPRVVTVPLRMMAVNGLLVAVALSAVERLRARFDRTFLSSRHAVR
jgi:hypothetical protein